MKLYLNPIENIAPISQLEKLQFLTLRDNKISDLTPLSQLKKVKVLDLIEMKSRILSRYFQWTL